MLKQVRQTIIQHLWRAYHETTPHIQKIEVALQNRGIVNFPLDHLAIIDLPGPHSGIPVLKEIFTALGYTEKGKGYLPDKQNDFVWLSEEDSSKQFARNTLPQVVVADFRLEELPNEVRAIILKYSEQAQPVPLATIQQLASEPCNGDAAKQLVDWAIQYFKGREWPLPTRDEFHCVKQWNELLAWVLVFGRRPNHFTVSVHLLDHFADLPDFHQFIVGEAGLALNHEGGTIKGNQTVGIAQGSTVGVEQAVLLQDGTVSLPTGFVEFVWRYPNDTSKKPEYFDDYFTGFVATYANHVIESLYTDK